MMKDLREKVNIIIQNIKDNGQFPNENNSLDYKSNMKISDGRRPHEQLLINFAKDIVSFSNSDGGIIILGIKENKEQAQYRDDGLEKHVIDTLDRIDLNDVSQALEKIFKTTILIDLQKFKISTRTFYYILIAKGNQILIPINDNKEFGLYKGDIYYRTSGKNEKANNNTADFNKFLQSKANEKSKEFMEIWSKLMPEMFDINPREVLILNPTQSKIYGFNGKDNILSETDIEIDREHDGVFNIILNAISAGEIGKITTTEGKPIYKIVGEIVNEKKRVNLSNLEDSVRGIAKYKFTNAQMKQAIAHLGWVTDDKFKINHPDPEVLNDEFSDYIWTETTDSLTGTKKIFLSESAVAPIVEIINSKELHMQVFGKLLNVKK